MAYTDLSTKLTKHARSAIETAEHVAARAGSTTTQPLHLLFGVFLQKGSVGATILTQLGISQELLEHVVAVTSAPPSDTTQSTDITPSAALKKVITDAYAFATEIGYPYVGTEHFVYILLDSNIPEIKALITKAQEVKKATKDSAEKNDPKDSSHSMAPMNIDSFHQIGQLLRGDTSQLLTPYGDDGGFASPLEEFCVDMRSTSTDERFIGRAAEIAQTVTVLSRKNKNNPLLIGDPGVGKTALIEHLAHYLHTADAPPHLRNKNILMLDLTLLIAGTSFRGEFEQRLKDVIDEAQRRDDVILFVDEIHTIVGAGNVNGSLDAANILKPALARGTLRLIGATTHDEYKKHLAKDHALTRRFATIDLVEPTTAETLAILKGARKPYEYFHRVKLPDNVLEAAVTLSARYMPEKFFPDKAFDLIDESAAEAKSTRRLSKAEHQQHALKEEIDRVAKEKSEAIASELYDAASELHHREEALTKELQTLHTALKKSRKDVVMLTVADLERIVARTTGIPHEKIARGNTTMPPNMLATLQKHVIGQNHALEQVVAVLERSFAGLTSEHRPHGSFLFLGPTGVGKTLTAQVLAHELYGSEKSLIRIDMSEFMERHNTSKLLGAPAGYVGYGDGGTLTERVRRQPHSVVLFDEIEKAHPETLQLLLQILEDGQLTDGEGRVTDFRHTLIILTSNLGSEHFAKDGDFGFGEDVGSGREERVTQTLKDTLPPELLARLDHITIFHELAQKDLEKIARIEIKKITARVKERHEITVTAPQAIARFIAAQSTSKDGARGVRKALQERLEHVLARYLVENDHPTPKAKLAIKKDQIVVQ